MREKVKVSIIIPVFNAEKFISFCIESLIKQTLRECEFIFINDGSSDKSKYLIEEYRKLDPRIILYNQNNQGVSAARNEGLRRASGSYVGFVDADDFVEIDMFEKLYNVAISQNSDLLMSNLECEIEGHKVVISPPFPDNKILDEEFIQDEVLPYYLMTDDLNSTCNKLYRKELIDKYNLEFPVKVALGEDSLFNMSFLSRASNCLYLNYTGYHYREVKGSATRNIIEKDYFKNAIEVYKREIPKEIFNEGDFGKLKKYKAIKLIESVLSYIHLYFSPNTEISFIKRYYYIKRMLKNDSIKNSLLIYKDEKKLEIGRYEKILLTFIKLNFTLGLYGITAYSRFRNRKLELIK
ncbi:glycosyltransferase [Bacillus haimaensis]|uniref:glycosyltransferase n=1 Tax=Bacillus haimaensis TaxID=3160967 RepID=UPI003AA807A5